MDISEEDLQCKLADEGVALKDLSKDAEEGETVVALFEIGEHMPYGNLMFFTKQGMIIRFTTNDVNPIGRVSSGVKGIKLNDGDEVVNEKDLRMLDRLALGEDNIDNIHPSDSVDELDMIDSDDDTYDPANPDSEDYF